jgi:hypothetical protein
MSAAYYAHRPRVPRSTRAMSARARNGARAARIGAAAALQRRTSGGDCGAQQLVGSQAGADRVRVEPRNVVVIVVAAPPLPEWYRGCTRHTHTLTNSYLYTYIGGCTRHTHTFTNSYLYICRYIYVYIYICTYTHTHKQTHTHAHAYILIDMWRYQDRYIDI